MTEAEFLETVATNPNNRALLLRLPELGLPDCYLTAGCLFQTCWNEKEGGDCVQHLQYTERHKFRKDDFFFKKKTFQEEF